MITQPLGPACRAVSQLWDSVVDDFLAGREIRRSLKPWAESYKGKDDGAVEWDALPQLFLGPLTKPRGVFLALNPGRADLRFQGQNGIFADEIRANGGSFSAWAASWPYLRDPWVAENGRNRHHTTRLRLTAYLGLTKGTLSQTLSTLEAKGLVTKQVDPVDR